MARYPFAKWVPTNSKNWGNGLMADPVFGVLLHITDGAMENGKKKLGELENMNASFDNRHNSVHFAIAKSGEIWQFVDTAQSARALGGGYRDTKWISVENLALPGDVLTSGQIDSLARLCRWLAETHGLELREVDVHKSVIDFDNGKELGLGGHSMYRDPNRVNCPGPAILAQRKDILVLAGLYGLFSGPIF